jgi:DNA/RNA-binding domain of Phe-tRNA-synthetase-like protein
VSSPESLPTLPLAIDAEIAPRIRIGSFLVEPISTGDRPPSLDAELADLAEKYRSTWDKPADALSALGPARRLYHAFGIDPSKTRPSSEALLRRILKGKNLYRVNAVVDAANLASLTLLLPVGLYDTKKLRPPLRLRLGRTEEGFDGIRKDRINVAGRPTLVDEVGPFGNPTSDSLRTSITAETRSVWFVLFAPADHPKTRLEDDLRRAEAILREHAGE